MDIKDRLDDLVSHQKEVLKQYEELVQELNLNDSLNENIALRKEINNYNKLIEALKEEQAELLNENMNLKVSLKEQVINEKTSILNGSKKKIELYFKNEANKTINKLESLEATAKHKLDRIIKIAEKELNEERKETVLQIEKYKAELEQKVNLQKENLISEKENIFVGLKREYDELKNEGISNEVLEAKKKYNDIEVKIGLSWINKAGIIILLLGIATAMKYTYSTWFNDYLKAASGFLFGTVMLAVGEWFNRKDKNIFALGLSGGGIGILYSCVFSSYFILNILSMPISIAVSILITAVSLVLALRYHSLTICGISLIGGYLPFFSYVFAEGLLGSQIYIAMGYLLILNVLVLGICLKRKWIYINYLSFLLNMPCLVYLAFESPNKIISISYGILIFIIYLAITLLYPIKEKIKLKKMDLVLLGLNTIMNSFLVYELFEIAGYDSYKGLLALIYAVIYLLLGQFIYKSASQEKSTQALFYITAITFCILMIPFQFGIEWASLGWLIEAILIISYAVRKNAVKMEWAGWIILGLCFVDFMFLDFPWLAFEKNIIIKYTMVTLGLIYVLACYLKQLYGRELSKYTKKGRFLTYYKYFAIINTWVYLIRVTSILWDKYYNILGYYGFYYTVSIAFITSLFAYGISKVKVIQDKVVTGIAIVFYILVDLLGMGMNFSRVGESLNTVSRVIPVIILIAYDIFVFFSVKDLILKLIKKKGMSLEIYPISLAVYILGIPTLLLVKQFNISNINLVISIFFVVMSFAYITYGFRKKFVLIRRFGLGLSIFSTGKLFIFDLAFLNTVGKIVAYFCFGLVLIGISFIYHKLKTSIEDEGDNEHEKNSDYDNGPADF